ncbi:MAG: DUF4421 family protein [Bacteroidia bacterium]|nr:DUF4421 family protein [Bacteroidia bacterium]
MITGLGSSHAQLDSLALKLVDSLKAFLIDEQIPKKTFKDKFMYPHRWYVKQLLKPTNSDLDSTYIRSLKHKLTLALPVAKKYYGFNYTDLGNSKILRFSPNNYYYVGFNIGNIILNFGFYPGIRFGAKPGRGNTRMKDLQLTLIGRRVITDVNYQDYSGFYLFNYRDYSATVPDMNTILIRPDISSFFFGVNTMFVFNYKKYSLRGSFSFTDIQRKSVGSFMAGLYHSYFLGTSDSSFIPLALRNEFSPELRTINRISIYTLGLSAGYGYSFVYKKIILTAAFNIGAGAQINNYETNDKVGHALPINASLHLNSKAAIRYDNYRFFVGLMSNYSNNYALSPRLFNTETYTARLVLFCGYRFNIKQNGRKVLRTLGLVDYNNPVNKKGPAKKARPSK